MSGGRHGRPECGGPCPTCGKLRWPSRAAAKKAARQMTGRVGGRLTAYRCGDYWHLGHPPSLLVRGVVGRDEVGPAIPRDPYGRTPTGERRPT